MQYYLCFKVNKIPDLTMIKYSVYDISGQEDLIDKHSVFLRQLHRLGVESNVFFHLLYYYDGSEGITKGKRLQIIFYATAETPKKLELIREFVTTSVLSAYYDFYCYEISSSLDYILKEGYLQFTNLSNTRRNYKLSSSIRPCDYDQIKQQISDDGYLYCAVEPHSSEVTEINSQSFYLDDIGRIGCDYEFDFGAFLTKKDYHLYAQNRLYNDPQNTLIPIYSIMEWIPNTLGRLYNVLKLMEGYNETCALRVDIFPVDIAESFNDNMASTINELRQRMAQHEQGKDDNCDTILKSIENITKKLMKFPQFFANIVAFADHKDIAVMLVDSVGAEAVESGSYLVKNLRSFSDTEQPYNIYSHDNEVIIDKLNYGQNGNYMSEYVSLYTLDEVRPMFSFPVLYAGESIECMKETDPEFDAASESTLYLGMSESGYAVNFPIMLFKKHAFIAGVPGAGKTNTLLYMVSELWNTFHIPFLVLEPAKQEYRALAKASKLLGMEPLKDICIFSPSADTRFPLHINPFEFPLGLTLAEHIANLNAVFAGAFELPPPSPHFIDTCIEQVYVNKGWNINSRNNGSLPYPTMQELYDSLNIAVQNSHYQGETLGNLRSVMEVRVGSLLKREIGNVYNVEMSSFKPEEWLDRPVIIELEALGEGPANFMALLISTLIRETLKIRKTQSNSTNRRTTSPLGVNHVIFYEEAHNLVGPTQENIGDKVDPKVSATKFLVKMLAEVRALDEGIVIADQLPSVMAPEVLKNTGLKIGHRITATDDRELLGSTMSASGDQLAEQSIYMPGEALVFYEGLLKPFKMQMTKWQRSPEEYTERATDELFSFLDEYYQDDGETTIYEKIEDYFNNVYDSPTDIELYSLIKDYPIYQELNQKSMEIILQRTVKLFSAIYDQISDLNHSNIVPAFIEGDKWITKIKKYKRLCSSSGKVVEVLTDINKMESQFTNPKSLFTDLSTVKGDKKVSITSKLSSLLTECNNLLFNNVSIVGNYGSRAYYMCANIIEAYLHAFECIDWLHLWGNKPIDEILNKTQVARQEIEAFVNIETDKNGVLYGSEFYMPLKERSYAIRILEIIQSFNILHNNLLSIIDWKAQTANQAIFHDIATDYEKEYNKWITIASNYSEHQPLLKVIIISKYLELFDCLDYYRDIREIAHYLYQSTQRIRYDIYNIVFSENDAAISSYDDYNSLRNKCLVFKRIEIYEVYYNHTQEILKQVLSDVHNDFAMMNTDQLMSISRAYQTAYYKCCDICASISVKEIARELLAENIDLFYTLITEIGINLQGTTRGLLDKSISNTYSAISRLRTKFSTNAVREMWKKADSYWNHNS